MLQGLAVALCRLVSVLFLPPLPFQWLASWQGGPESVAVSYCVCCADFLCALDSEIGASENLLSVESENDRIVQVRFPLTVCVPQRFSL